MSDQRTMEKLLRAPTEGYVEAIVVPLILAEQFKLKHSLINIMNSNQFFGLEKVNPHDHIRWGSLSVARKRTPAYKDLLRAWPHHGFTELHQLDTFYNALNPVDQDSLNVAAGDNLLERRTQDVLTIIENKSKIAKLTHTVNQQTSAVTTAMTAMLKQFQATPPPAFVKVVEETCVTCGGAHPYYQCLAAGGSGSLPSNTVANPKGELKAITTCSGLVIDGPTVSTPPQSINPEVDEHVEETFTDPNLTEYTIKVPPHPVQKYKPPSQREYLHINITLADALILMSKYQKMLKALLSNKDKLQELANTPLNKNCSAVILKKLLEKLRDPGKFLIPCGFSELKYKALADLGASINLMPLSVWKKLGLPELISTHMTLELANHAICTPAGIARDVFVLVGKFTFPADFVIVDYESDPRVPLILGRPFLWTARALIDVHGEEMILRNSDERLIFNMRHGTSSKSNQPQKESINLINVFNNSKVSNVLSEKLLDLDSTKDLYPPLYDDPLSGSTTFSSNPLLEEFADELAFPLKYNDDLQFDIESDLKEIEFLLYQDVDSSLKNSIDQKIESNAENVYDDPFDSKGEKIKESTLLIDELDLSCDFLPSEYDSFISQDFSKVDALPSTNNEDKIFNPGILIQEKSFEIITRVVQDKKLATSMLL
uniref:Reverse transcriptase domain-containing protein n=1 Tax=Tanacetum cinerariifolium TaxID=118510 RepID=A0A6L2JDU3_TANCI|nr:reverse transcriptase domain-containing protein [Tanacetum cinerariifolium]